MLGQRQLAVAICKDMSATRKQSCLATKIHDFSLLQEEAEDMSPQQCYASPA